MEKNTANRENVVCREREEECGEKRIKEEKNLIKCIKGRERERGIEKCI